MVPAECPLPPQELFHGIFSPCQAVEGGREPWVLSRASQGRAHTAQHLHSLGRSQGSLGSLLLPRAAFLGQFSKDEASGTFPMVGNPAGNNPAPGGSLGGWRGPCAASPTLRIPAGLVLGAVVQLSSALGPLWIISHQAGSSKSTIRN